MLTLRDLWQLYRRYVPPTSRHPNTRLVTGYSWWPAHELGHLLTVPRAWIGKPMFGLDSDDDPLQRRTHERICRELAAMVLSARLLRACNRVDLFAEELEYTNGTTLDYLHRRTGQRRVHAILVEHRCLRIPRTRPALEAKLQRLVRSGAIKKRPLPPSAPRPRALPGEGRAPRVG